MPSIIIYNEREYVIGIGQNSGNQNKVLLDRLALIWMLSDRYTLSPSDFEKLKRGQSTKGLTLNDLSNPTIEEIESFAPLRGIFSLLTSGESLNAQERAVAAGYEHIIQRVVNRKKALERTN